MHSPCPICAPVNPPKELPGPPDVLLCIPDFRWNPGRIRSQLLHVSQHCNPAPGSFRFHGTRTSSPAFMARACVVAVVDDRYTAALQRENLLASLKPSNSSSLAAAASWESIFMGHCQGCQGVAYHVASHDPQADRDPLVSWTALNTDIHSQGAGPPRYWQSDMP